MNRLWIAEYPSTQVLVFGSYTKEEAQAVLDSHGWEGNDNLVEQTLPAMFERQVDWSTGDAPVVVL